MCRIAHDRKVLCFHLTFWYLCIAKRNTYSAEVIQNVVAHAEIHLFFLQLYFEVLHLSTANFSYYFHAWILIKKENRKFNLFFNFILLLVIQFLVYVCMNMITYSGVFTNRKSPSEHLNGIPKKLFTPDNTEILFSELEYEIITTNRKFCFLFVLTW